MVGDVTIDTTDQNLFKGFATIAISHDTRLGFIPEHGLSLLEVIRCIPGMARLLGQLGVATRCLRGEANQARDSQQQSLETTVVIHPGEQNLLDEFLDNSIANQTTRKISSSLSSHMVP